MRTLKVSTGEQTYPILIGRDLYARLPEWLRSRGIGPDRPLMLVTDTHVGPLYGEKVAGPLRAAGYRVGEASVPAGESSKSLEQLPGWWRKDPVGLDRRGGAGPRRRCCRGFTGFLAASYMRGIPLSSCPRPSGPRQQCRRKGGGITLGKMSRRVSPAAHGGVRRGPSAPCPGGRWSPAMRRWSSTP